MKYRVTAGAGIVAVAVAVVFAVAGVTGDGDGSGTSPTDTATEAQVVAPPAPADEAPAGAVAADPSNSSKARDLVLTAPANVSVGQTVTFGASWTTASGQSISGEVDLQRIEGTRWATVTTVPVEDGAGQVDLPVEESGIYRLAYGGSEPVEAAASTEMVVRAEEALASRITATAENADDGVISVTAAWTTDGGAPITGDLHLERAEEGEWVPVAKGVTSDDGTVVLEVEADQTARFRFTYAGGSRFAAATSDVAVALGDDIRTIPVEVCDDSGDLDVLGNGVGCHYTPVSAGTFVAAHDYLGNAWWNSIPVGSFVELTGELPGVYEVVDRVIAPARGSALGPASDWTCGDACDVILQTCQGKNTGFTWLSRVSDLPPDA